VWKRRLVRSDLDAQAVQRITRGYLFGLPFYALSIVLSLINVELSLAFYILNRSDVWLAHSLSPLWQP
jgi:hypothetical protein